MSVCIHTKDNVYWVWAAVLTSVFLHLERNILYFAHFNQLKNAQLFKIQNYKQLWCKNSNIFWLYNVTLLLFFYLYLDFFVCFSKLQQYTHSYMQQQQWKYALSCFCALSLLLLYVWLIFSFTYFPLNKFTTRFVIISFFPTGTTFSNTNYDLISFHIHLKTYKYCSGLRFALDNRNKFSYGIYKYFYLFMSTQLYTSDFHLPIMLFFSRYFATFFCVFLLISPLQIFTSQKAIFHLV